MKIKNDKNGKITLELIDGNRTFYLHSKYDVYSEAKKICENFSKKTKKINILYGFGLGYHVEAIGEKLKKNQKLYVLELRKDIYDFARKNRDLSSIYNNHRIRLIVRDNYKQLIYELKKIYINDNDVEFFIHEPSVRAIQENNKIFKDILDDLKINKRLKLEKYQNELFLSNIEFNKKLKDSKAGMFFDKFNNIPGILIASGPSLDYSIEKLEKFKEKSILFSVGRSLRAFDNLNFEPDLFMIVDPQPITKQHIIGYEYSSIPFIYLISVFNGVVENYKGPRFYFQNTNMRENTNYINMKYSVSNGVLSMLIKMKCNPIILVGQDFGFYKENHHSKRVMYDGYSDKSINIDYKYETIKNVFGNEIYTNKGYKSMKYFMESIIKENRNIEFINASYKGAQIEGAKYMDIEDVYEKYIKNKNFDIEEKIKNIINNK
ncbi:MAG: DUF115 domain-containing protein [Peptostreptococcaceae bacterium]|nr:DUF115 domain-containing protein [Peptostreptococcaceae bacterium]